MAGIQIRNLDRDGERRAFANHGEAVLGNAGGVSMMKARFDPGWRWSTDVGPMAGTPTCQTRHLGYLMSGRMHVVMDDGSEYEIEPGDLFDLAAGHDAWVVGDQPCVMVDTSPEVVGYAAGSADGASVDRYLALVRRGFDAFNRSDVETLTTLMSHDVIHHSPGEGPLAGEYKGIESVLGFYGKLAEMTEGTFRVDLIDVHGDGRGHVAAMYQSSATRGGVTRVSRGTMLFTFVGEKVMDLLELRADLAGDDAFMSA